MRNFQREKQGKRRMIRATQLLKDLELARRHLQANALFEDDSAINLYADDIAHLWRLSSDSAMVQRIADWIRSGDATIEDVYPFTNLVRLYWAHSEITDARGNKHQTFMPDQEELRDFIRPGHIYLDVTSATLEDVKEIWGERQQQKRKHRETIERIPDLASHRAKLIVWELKSHKRQLQDDANSLLAMYDVPPPKQGKKYTHKELAGHLEKRWKSNIAESANLFWSPGRFGGNTVSEIQDFLESVGRWQSPMKGEARAGRKSGVQSQEWAQWKARARVVGWEQARKEYLANEERGYKDREGSSIGWRTSEERRKALRRFRENLPKPK